MRVSFDESMTSSFVEVLGDTSFPAIPPIHVAVEDPQVWFDTVRELKSGEAGLCSWRHEELKAHPRSCFLKLSLIFIGFSTFQSLGF